MGGAKERPPQFPSQLWIAYGLAALLHFNLVAAQGGSRGRLRISAPLLFGHVADRPIRTTAIRRAAG
jgi:uncharacterized protein (DUF2062 family)